MPPKLSVTLFNRICTIDLDTFKDVVNQLESLSESDPHYLQDAMILHSSLKAEYASIYTKFEGYLTAETLPENLSEETLQAGFSKLKSLMTKGELCYNRLVNHAQPMAQSTMINPINTSPTEHRTNATNTTGLSNQSMLSGSELPRFSIPIFDGKNLSNFNEFYVKFISFVDENPVLTPKQKLLYLLNHLKDSAYDKISLLPVNDSSYSVALQTLKDRYLNDKLVVKSHCKKLLELPAVSIDSPSSMRDFVDIFNLNYAYLVSLGTKNIYEAIYVTLMLSCFDDKLRYKYETSQTNTDTSQLPKASEVISFLTNLAVQKENALCNINSNQGLSKSPCSNKSKVRAESGKWRKSSKPNSKTKDGYQSFATSSNTCSTLCYICTEYHPIKECPKLLCVGPRERFKLVKSNQLCISCLRSKHPGDCVPVVTCDKCRSPRHHTLLHFEDKPAPKETLKQPASAGAVNGAADSLVVVPTVSTTVLMATCLVRVQVTPNKYLVVRGILDSASQLSFITENCAALLGVQRFCDRVNISGIGLSTPPPTKGVCNLAVATINGDIITNCHSFHILPSISNMTPKVPLSPKVFEATRGLVLADPTFGQPARVDILLNAEMMAALLNGPSIPLGEGMPIAVSTKLGYVIMGRAPIALDCNAHCVENLSPLNLDIVSKHSLHSAFHEVEQIAASAFLSVAELPDVSPFLCSYSPYMDLSCNVTCLISTLEDDRNLNSSISRFWEIEEPPQAGPFLSNEEQKCEEFYVSTTTRDSTGRYVVRLPFKEDSAFPLGDSYSEALSRLRSLERKFLRNPEFKSLYIDFMREYQLLGHMVPVTDPNFPKYFIPHHGIFKTHGDQNKIRVVFDASCKTTSGSSLNDVLMTGKGLQSLISDVITLFRRHRFVFCSDIQQMFRQILVHLDDCAFQCILWREQHNDPISIFMLRTVTYGMTCAPYLAIRSLLQLALDEGSAYPLAYRAIKENVFVDDFASGSHTLEQASMLIQELIELLNKGGFSLKKWASNSPELLSLINVEDQVEECILPGVLGLCWDPKKDLLSYPVKDMVADVPNNPTKRVVMSQVARLYDPVGFVSPVVLHAKCFMQTLWRLSLDWDSPLPPELADRWKSFVSSLKLLSSLTISRFLNIVDEIQLHGFCDASQSGYAASLYVRSLYQDRVSCTLLTSKTKVAPLKVLSIPRLELQGAHLLSKLIKHYKTLLSSQVTITETFLWTDSSIVLKWIKTPPHLLKTFVANRVAQISEYTEGAHWLWVPGEDNPSDLASRGCDPSHLLDSKIWFEGPPWLCVDKNVWPSPPLKSHSFTPDELELRETQVSVLLSVSMEQDLFPRISCWRLLLRVMVLLVKWRYKRDFLVDVDLHALAFQFLMRYIQLQSFSSELRDLQEGRCPRVAIQRLVPFVDGIGLMRARGRLSNIEGDPRYPIILPKAHRLVHLLIHHTHIKLGHAGPHHVQYHLSLSVWILAARQVIRSVIFKCVTCFRAKPRSSPPLMAELPRERVNPAPVFYHTGMDYCGPFTVKAYALRKAPLVKTYLCIFICMAVKAVHLELALDMSTDAFLDVLKRFISRRGCPSRLFCDCGTNFAGADRALATELKKILTDSDNSNLIKNFALQNNIEFSFLPSASPSMGGLWERAVQSTKYHLRRVIGKNVLTAQQLNSLMVQIEGVLNSRPITPLPAEPNDCQALTPGHFLIGRPITAPPERDTSFLSDNVLGHYQLVQALLGRFWKQWRLEYLSTLQARSKWCKENSNLSVGDVVVVEEPNCAPLHWPLARVTSVFPAKDGVVRRAEVKTSSGNKYLRSALKLYRLPVDQQ